MKFNNYEAFSISLGEALQEMALEAKERKDAAIGTENETFLTGYLTAFHRVITLAQQQAEIFDINLEDIGLDKIKESDLI